MLRVSRSRIFVRTSATSPLSSPTRCDQACLGQYRWNAWRIKRRPYTPPHLLGGTTGLAFAPVRLTGTPPDQKGRSGSEQQQGHLRPGFVSRECHRAWRACTGTLLESEEIATGEEGLRARTSTRPRGSIHALPG